VRNTNTDRQAKAAHNDKRVKKKKQCGQNYAKTGIRESDKRRVKGRKEEE